jgi:hypothetical protein
MFLLFSLLDVPSEHCASQAVLAHATPHAAPDYPPRVQIFVTKRSDRRQ